MKRKSHDFEEFKHIIDTRRGYLQEVAGSIDDFKEDMQEILDEQKHFEVMRAEIYEQRGEVMSVFQSVLSLTDDAAFREENPYSEKHCSEGGNKLDQLLPRIKDWHNASAEVRLKMQSEMGKKEFKQFQTQAAHFFTDGEQRLYHWQSQQSDQPQLVVNRPDRMRMLYNAHDCLAHKGAFATKAILEKRFWWPDMQKDVEWYVRSCLACQHRQLTLIKSPPAVTHTPSLFQKVHVDTMSMTPESNGCKYIVHGRDALSSWSEARALRQENARTIGEWFFDDIICRWGCPEEVVTDNAPQMRSMLKWLERKYGIKGINISAYNSQANGKIERAHFDIRQALVKATGGDVKKWYYFLKPVLWSDRITPRRGLGCSPYFLSTGAEPILPFDIVEATWLVNPPGRILSREELIGYRAQALSKHNTFVLAVQRRVDENKRRELRLFEEKY